MHSLTLFLILSVFFFTFPTPLGGGKAFGAAPVPDPGEPGPYAAGSISFGVPAPHRGGELIRVIVWYPVDKNLITSTTPRAIYPLNPILLPPALLALISTLWPGVDPAYRNVPPAGAFPLVVISHGYSSAGWFHLNYGARLASHGFVVATMTHPHENQFGCPGPFCLDPQVSRQHVFENRPKDISRVIDELLNRNNTSGDLLYNAIQIDKIYAVGHSLGGRTIVKAFSDGDTRIKGLISLDGAIRIDMLPDGTMSEDLMADQLAQVNIPVLLLSEEPCEPPLFNELPKCHEGGSVEQCTFPSPGGPLVCNTVEECLSPMRAQALIPTNPDLIIINRSDHGAAFSNSCEFFSVLAFLGVVISRPECAPSPEVIPFMDAHHLVNKYSVAFLKRLSGEWQYGKFFAPGNFLVNEPDAELIKTQPGNFESIEHMNAEFFCDQPGRQSFVD